MRRLCLSCCMLVATFASAQTLDECRTMARNHYPEIRKYGLIDQAEQYNLSNAAKAWLPQVTFSGQATYQSATPTYPDAFSKMMQAKGIDMSGIEKDQYKVAVDVSQNIWDGGQYKANKAIAEAEAAEQRSRTDVSLYALQSRVDNLYFGILLLDERVVQTKSLIAVLESNLGRLRSFLKNGVAMQADVDAVEAELLTARRRAVNASVMPRFSAFAQGYYGYPGLDMFKSMTKTDLTLNGIVGVRMSWNVGALYTKKNNLDKLATAQNQIAVQRDVFLFNTSMQTMQEDGEVERLRLAVEDDAKIVELRRRVRLAAESQLKNGVIDATDLLRKIADETTAVQNQSTHEIELLQTVYRLKTTLNQ